MTNTHALLVFGRESETVDKPLKSQSDRDLLLTIAVKVNDMWENVPKLEARVNDLEASRDEYRGHAKALKGLTYVSGGGGVMGLVSAAWHFFMHTGGK